MWFPETIYFMIGNLEINSILKLVFIYSFSYIHIKINNQAVLNLREGRVVKVVNPKLRKFRNNLRSVWLFFNLSQRNRQRIKRELRDLSGNKSFSDGSLYRSKIEAKRIANYSICLCPICSKDDRDMIWHQYSETWYCESCYYQLVASEVPDSLRSKVLQLQDNDKFDELYSCKNFLTKLPLIALARLLLDTNINLIELLVKQRAERKYNWKRDDFEIGLEFHEDNELISQIISKKIVSIISKMDEAEVESVLKLHLHQNIHFRDFITLAHKIKEFFFVLTHKFCLNYFPDYPEYEILCLGQIELLRSGYIRQYVTKIVKKGDPQALRELFRDHWLDLLNKSDFLSLMNASELGLFEILLDVNKDIPEYAYNYELPSRFQKLRIKNLVEKIKKTIGRKDKKLIIVLFRLKFFKKLNENDVSEITKDHRIVEILYELRQECYSDSVVKKAIFDFFKKNKNLLRTSARKMVVDRLMGGNYERIIAAWDFNWFSYLPENDLRAPMKQMIIDSFMEGNHQKLFAAWSFGWFSYLQESDWYDLLERRELHFLDNLLLALHHYGYKGKYHQNMWDIIYKFPFTTDFALHRIKSGDALRPQIVEVITNIKKEALIPLFALGYVTTVAFLYYNNEQNCLDEFWDEIYKSPFSDNPRFGKALKRQIVEVVENGKNEALVPLVALGYINLLEPKKIASLFENRELKLFTKLYTAHKSDPWEYPYFNLKFCAWKNWFNAFLERLGIGKVFYVHFPRDQYPC